MGGGGGVLKAIVFGILGLISATFGLIIILFILTYFPQEGVSNFASAALAAGASILGALPDIVDFVRRRLRAA